VNHGFLIDNRKCIGCHACSTACKSENQVPLGVSRTWVKTTESGLFPDVTRHFQVTRCNHCENPPCAKICPVTAMYRRADGIVEFDPDVCIGCKGCLQACPYDAVHIDPDKGTAAKCHFCAHRVEVGMEPACVVVCPEHAIIAGDLDDPTSKISRELARNPVSVRKPEQGTRPNLFYVGGQHASLDPLATLDAGGRMFTDATADGPISIGSPTGAAGPHRVAGQMVQTAYTVRHPASWHWPVPAYLVTKGIAAGIFGMLSAMALSGAAITGLPAALAGGLGVLMLAVTTGLLLLDLERPERFLSIVLRPQWGSWIARGAFILIAFSGAATAWWGAEIAAWMGWIADVPRAALALLTAPLAAAGAVYTAFLLAQAEGRDLWQSPLLPTHLLIEAAIAGSAALLVIGPALGEPLPALARTVLVVALFADLAALGLGELAIPHASTVAARAAREIVKGRYARMFWGGAIGLGHIAALALLAVGHPVASALAGVCALIGLYLYEFAFVMAPQQIPNS